MIVGVSKDSILLGIIYKKTTALGISGDVVILQMNGTISLQGLVISQYRLVNHVGINLVNRAYSAVGHIMQSSIRRAGTMQIFGGAFRGDE
jgi:hypothetical protein